MDFLFRSNAPAYQGKGQGTGKASPPTQSVTGFLSGLWCTLFGGGAAPSYKGETNGATASSASPWFAGLSQTPQYKTPPEPSDPEPEPSPSDEPTD